MSFASDLQKFDKRMNKALEKSFSDTFDLIGRESTKDMLKANTYSVKTKAKRKTFPKNPSNKLRVRSGDLKRSMTSNNIDSIRVVKKKLGKIQGVVGTKVNNKGFYYPHFHEKGTRFAGWLSKTVKRLKNEIGEIAIKHINRIKL